MSYYDMESFFYGNVAAQIMVILLIIAIWVGLFFLFRAITLWYLKINKMLKEMQRSNEYLMRITMALEQGGRIPPMGGGFVPGPAVPGANPIMPGVNPVVPENNPAMPGEAPVMDASLQTFGMGAANEKPETAQAPEKHVCRQCGAVLQDGASFCVQCGTRN